MATPSLKQSVASGVFPATNTVTTATSGTLATAATAGNLLVWFVAVDKNATAFTAPSGWASTVTAPNASVSIAIFTKIAAGGETSASCSWTTPLFGYGSILCEYQNCSGVDVAATPAYSDTARTSMSLGPATPTVDGLATAFFAMDSAIDTGSLAPASTDWTVATSSYDTAPASGRPALAIDHRTTPTAAGTAVPATTFTWTNSDQVHGSMILLKSVSTDTTAPIAPTNVTAVADSSSQVTVSWTAGTDNVGVTSYRVVRNGVELSSVITGTSYVDTGLSPSTTYAYSVVSLDAAGNRSGGSSNTASVTTPAASSGLQPPTGLAATGTSTDTIYLTWNAATGATSYDVERDGAVISTGVTATNYTDTGLAAGTTHSYRVRSVG